MVKLKTCKIDGLDFILAKYLMVFVFRPFLKRPEIRNKQNT